jgi:SPP1 family predicted phage head-tail adaptor
MTSKTTDYSAGEFRFNVVVQKNVAKADNYGGQGKPEWVDFTDIWCKITEKGGNEVFGEGTTGRIRSVQTVVFVTWWTEEVLTTHRLIWKNKAYNINDIKNVEERNKFTEIIADSGVET